ncbi:hypothetical protein GBO22_24095, partial [Mycobacterium avium subsp. hominissuis]|nr:hypothetical protein [Mycobacterium avium subsp. hominissuis]
MRRWTRAHPGQPKCVDLWWDTPVHQCTAALQRQQRLADRIHSGVGGRRRSHGGCERRSRPVEWCKSGRVSACGSVVATMP